MDPKKGLRAGREAVTQCRVLIAEDDDGSREMLAAYLELQGHTVFAATDGADALAAAPHFQPEVVVTDICMPRLSGVELRRQLRRQHETRFVPVFAMTAVVAGDWKELTAAGFEYVIAKPVELDQLERRVIDACERHRRIQQR